MLRRKPRWCAQHNIRHLARPWCHDLYPDFIPVVFAPQRAVFELTEAKPNVVQVLDDLVERLPDQFDMEDIRGRVDEFTPYVMVAIQVTLTTEQLQLQMTFMPNCASSTSSTSTTSKPTSMYFLASWR